MVITTITVVNRSASSIHGGKDRRSGSPVIGEKDISSGYDIYISLGIMTDI